MGTLQLVDHATRLADFLHTSFKTRDVFCDIQLVTSDQVSFKVHKVIAATFSQYFQKEFELLDIKKQLSIGKYKENIL